MTRNRLLRSLLLMFCLVAVGSATTSCSDDDTPAIAGNGITNASWADINDADINGQTLIHEFEAAAAWTASSDAPWCKLITEKGGAGKSSLRIKVEPNTDTYGRSAKVSVQVAGYAEPCVLTIRQGEGFIEKGDGTYRDVNQWVNEFMAANYLWNEPVGKLTLDYSVDYQSFLLSMLDGIAAYDDVNHEDGLWVNGERQAYFSYISSNAPISRTTGTSYTDSGMAIIPTILGSSTDPNANCGFAVRWVTPGSPADEAGVKRGDFISTVNRIAVTESNYQSLGATVLNGNVTIDLNSVKFENGVFTVTNRVKSVLVGKDTYVDPAIYSSTILTSNDGKKIGYIMLMGFHTDYDKQLIETFDIFKSNGIDELVVDLRFNTGGHVLSSTVLGTLVAGTDHSGETYLRTTYNAARTAAGEKGEYFIGSAANPENNSYAPIATALTSSLNLKRVFVIGTNYTASASELFINGLRGLGITVNLIGTTTMGKNVGMEGWQKKFGSYNFIFYPVTFYCENAKGFRNYSNGFKPDLELDDTHYYPGDFGTMSDILTNQAVTWAVTGSKPSVNSRSNAALKQIKVLPTGEILDQPLTRRPVGAIALHE